MEHNDIRHKLSEYIDESVTAEERTAIEAHLKTCRECGDALEELRKTIAYVKTVEEIDPPTWMTQKIMANVRAEAEKKGLFERFFQPGSLRFPIQAVAVVFLAVTAFAIYRSIQPASVPSEAPLQKLASRKEPAKDVPAKTKTAAPADSAKRVPQAPEYKALEMTQEYEKPAAPRLMSKTEAPAPASADRLEQPLLAEQEAASGKAAAAPQAGAPVVMKEGSASASAAHRTEAKLKSARRALKPASADKSDLVLMVQAKDMETAVREVEQTITRLGGSITRRENPEAERIYVISISAEKFPELKNKLKLIGEVKDEAAAPMPQEGRVELRIELVQEATQQ
jgi:hypothetical protein